MSVRVLIAMLLGLFVGAVVGGLSGGFGQAVFYGGLIGLLGGWLVDLNRRVRRLESGEEADAVDSWHTDRARKDKVPEPAPPAASVRTAAPATSGVAKRADPPESAREPTAGSVWETGARPHRLEQEPDPSLVSRVLAVARSWCTTGNVPVKVGVVVVLFGVAFFINYAIERQLFSFPVWARLSCVALFGGVMLAIGWRLRKTREVYALSLQGGGLGVLYLTTYAAFEFYALLPATVAFGAMVVVTVATGILALVQDSRVLVVLGVAGGFLAPLLAATETGSHVLLFSYYAVLNAAIVGIAWFKAWRPLNLLGFAFTFVIGSLWGYQAYRPEHFATTEPFLVLFVLMYIGIAVLFALQRPPNLRGFVDSALVFGTPLVGFTLQTRIVESEAGLAWTAGGLAALYAVLGVFVWRIKDLRLLALSFGGLGLLFLATAFPLALDDRWTSVAWGVQAATLAWFGVRNGSRLLIFAGAALHVAAVVAHVRTGLFEPATTPVVNGLFLAGILLSLSAWVIAWSFDNSRLSPQLRLLWTQVAQGMAIIWWSWSGVREVVRFVDELTVGACLGFAAVSVIAAMSVAKAVRWQRLNDVGLTLLPAMVLLVLSDLAILTDGHPLGNFTWLAWPFAFGVQYAYLRYRETGYPDLAPVWHVGTYWVLALLVVSEARWLVGTVADGEWPLVAAVVSAAILAWTTNAARGRLAWPLDHHWRAYSSAGIRVVAVAAAIVVVVASLTSDGSAAPIPYLPLFNPLTIGAVVAFGAVWLSLGVEVRRRESRVIAPLYCLVALVLLSMEVARGVHHFADVPFTTAALAGSAVFQAGLSLVWGTAGLAGMIVGAVRKRREVWIGGAVVMGIVIVKLFVVELGNVGTLSRVVSFLGVGLLLLVVGYFAPVPKGRSGESADSLAPTAPGPDEPAS
ncbi:MAG: DUF2339 domain-containing protein [Gammaproteobacteria bacterium]|nr:DUF2339 domain-containing protein [Gammaproteobacteria bacterium]MDE0443711.1 DUF2339 domain-containing protein [Gammaproteobacteria bacterium]